jgi:3-oxo-4,17-pregnadiene-20-carboxyl-CoA hydratase alpha subunit
VTDDATAQAERLARFKSFEGMRSGRTFTARDAVNQAMIRHWADAMGDTNPVYVDDEAARATGRDGVIAPPTMLQAWTMPGLVPPPPVPGPATGFPALLVELEAAGYSSTVATNCEQTYHRELRIGDLITTSDVVEDVSPEKQTALGRGHFVTSRITFTDQHGEVVGEQMWRIFRFIPGTGATPPKALPPRPRPAINRDNAFFFEGAAEQRLLIQRCTGCGQLRHPPGPMCPHCHSVEWDTVEASGRGNVHSFVVNHYPRVPAFEYPLLVALIDLEEGTRLVSNLVDVAPDAVEIGMPVAVRWFDAGEGLTLPAFAPAGTAR